MLRDPYYSIVVCSRNDSHGGNIMKRMRLFMNGLLHQTRKWGLPVELVFVEWNPVSGQPMLHDILPKPQPGDVLQCRYIVVPPGLHNRYRRAKEIPLFQMIAKNVGIRRAKGQFILASNIDLLFSDPLMERLRTRDLNPGCFYRANRCDVPDLLDETNPVDKQLEFCAKNVMRVNGWDSRYKNVNRLEAGIGELGPISRWITEKIAARHRKNQPLGEREYYLLDRAACGDFTMMHRDAWSEIRGYAELDLYSIHVDTLGLVAARALGYEQVVFPAEACTYHIDHPAGWSAMGPIEKLRFLEQRPGIDHGVLQEVSYLLLEKNVDLGINGNDWGFSGENFEEFVF